MNTFEVRLASLFDRYAAAAPVEVDASALASNIAARDTRVIEVLGRTFVKPRWLVPALVTLMLLLALAAVFIGAWLLRLESVVPEHHYSGVVRPIAPGQISPSAILPLSDGTLFASLQTYTGNPDIYEIVNVETGDIKHVGRGLTTRQAPGLVELQEGRVLVLGADYEPSGEYSEGNFVPSTTVTAEIFDPATGETESAGSLVANRFEPTVVQLRDGRVLIAGGTIPPGVGGPTASAEIYDPATGQFTATGSMTEPRFQAQAVELPDGRILFVGISTRGAFGTQTAEIFDPTSGTFQAIEGPRDTGYGPAVRVRGGRALIVHSVCREDHSLIREGVSVTAAPPASAELYDPSVPGFVEAPALPHCISTLVGLPDGRAFASGFYYTGPGRQLLDWAGVYDPDDGSVEVTMGPRGYREHDGEHLVNAVGMADGRVLFFPGAGSWGDILE